MSACTSPPDSEPPDKSTRQAIGLIIRGISVPGRNRTPRLPPEVWEKVIKWVPQYSGYDWKRDTPLSRTTLLACALVCRAWLHSSQRLLFNVVELTNARQTKSFLLALKHSPANGQLVESLMIGPMQQDPGGLSKTPGYFNWIYQILHRLPPLLPNVSMLRFFNLPVMHKSFVITASRFTRVTGLTFGGLINMTFHEIIGLANHFHQLERLNILQCKWRQPAHYYSGRRHRIEKFVIGTGDTARMDSPKWLLASQSTSALTHLWIYDSADSALMIELNKIIQQCTQSLQVLGLKFQNDTLLDFPVLEKHTSLKFINFTMPLGMLGRYIEQNSIPPNLAMFYCHISNSFEEVFDIKHSQSWKTIDTTLCDSRLQRLTHFVVWTNDYIQLPITQKQNIMQNLFQNLFSRATIWCGDWNIVTACHVSSQSQEYSTWDHLMTLYP